MMHLNLALLLCCASMILSSATAQILEKAESEVEKGGALFTDSLGKNEFSPNVPKAADGHVAEQLEGAAMSANEELEKASGAGVVIAQKTISSTKLVKPAVSLLGQSEQDEQDKQV